MIDWYKKNRIKIIETVQWVTVILSAAVILKS